MNTFLKLLLSAMLIFSLTGCLYGQCIDGPCALERERMIQAIKPYGAHWIKEGVTYKSRLEDFTHCGGSQTLKEGYELRPNQTNEEFFQGFNAHVTQVASCMQAKGYTYLDPCDARCLYP